MLPANNEPFKFGKQSLEMKQLFTKRLILPHMSPGATGREHKGYPTLKFSLKNAPFQMFIKVYFLMKKCQFWSVHA